jgi:hypothetical protein
MLIFTVCAIALLGAIAFFLRITRIRKIGKDGLLVSSSSSFNEESIFSIIIEGVRTLIVKTIMDAVDRNHFSEQSESEWLATKEDSHSTTVKAIDSYIEDRWTSERITAKQLRESSKNNGNSLVVYQLYVKLMERLKAISVDAKEQINHKNGEAEIIKSKWDPMSQQALFLIQELIDADLAKLAIPQKAKDESRAVVRQFALELCQMLKQFARDAICGNVGCTD